MAGQRPIGKGIKDLISGLEGRKHEIHRFPFSKSFVGAQVVNENNSLTDECAHKSLIKGTYYMISGTTISTSVRYFSTSRTKLNNNWKGGKIIDDFPILNWMQKNELQKKKSSTTKQEDDPAETLTAVIKEIFNPKNASVANYNKNKNALNIPKDTVIKINATITISSKKDYHSFGNVSRKLTNTRISNGRNCSFQVTMTDYKNLNTTSGDLLSINPKITSLICYKPPETQISLFIKHYHDWKMPDFTEYRKKSCTDPKQSSSESDAQRRIYTIGLYYLYGLGLAYGTKTHGSQYVFYMAASADVLALAKIEINLSEIPEGRTATFKWRGKPLFVKHRSAADIEREKNVDLASLRDPQTDEERCPNPAWLVLIGICTHLGCVPIADAGDYPGGYYCPCHGSHFDGSGRTRKGPAPLNMEIPPYNIEGDIIVIG